MPFQHPIEGQCKQQLPASTDEIIRCPDRCTEMQTTICRIHSLGQCGASKNTAAVAFRPCSYHDSLDLIYFRLTPGATSPGIAKNLPHTSGAYMEHWKEKSIFHNYRDLQGTRGRTVYEQLSSILTTIYIMLFKKSIFLIIPKFTAFIFIINKLIGDH